MSFRNEEKSLLVARRRAQEEQVACVTAIKLVLELEPALATVAQYTWHGQKGLHAIWQAAFRYVRCLLLQSGMWVMHMNGVEEPQSK